MPENKHTPGPWKIATHLNDPWTVYADQEENEPGICTTDGSSYTPVDSEDEQIANAEFIVRACNSYDEMLTALLAIHEQRAIGNGHIPQSVFDQVLAAISKA